jgi:hypothetical protein
MAPSRGCTRSSTRGAPGSACGWRRCMSHPTGARRHTHRARTPTEAQTRAGRPRPHPLSLVPGHPLTAHHDHVTRTAGRGDAGSADMHDGGLICGGCGCPFNLPPHPPTAIPPPARRPPSWLPPQSWGPAVRRCPCARCLLLGGHGLRKRRERQGCEPLGVRRRRRALVHCLDPCMREGLGGVAAAAGAADHPTAHTPTPPTHSAGVKRVVMDTTVPSRLQRSATSPPTQPPHAQYCVCTARTWPVRLGAAWMVTLRRLSQPPHARLWLRDFTRLPAWNWRSRRHAAQLVG